MRNMLKKLNDVKCFLLDMDGTFYLGEEILEGSMEFLAHLKETGRDFMFLTNNSSRSAKMSVEKLAKMGVFIEDRQMFTSGQATALLLNDTYPGKRIYLLGNAALRGEMLEMGVNIVENDAEMVVVGFDTELTYEKMWRTCDLVRDGLPYLCTHPDFNCPTETGFMPDAGAILAFIEASTGRRPDLIVGKPYPPIVEATLLRTGLTKQELCIVGDRLYTDIKTGVDSGILSILVLTGETKQEDIAPSPTKPDLTFERLSSMIEHLQ